MNFTDLYRFAESLELDEIPVGRLAAQVRANHPTIGDVKFWACDLDPNISLGHMILELERSSPYDEPYILANIRFFKNLSRKWTRFVCCKELMHVFDNSLEKTSNKEKFLILMNELENNPIAVDQSQMFQSERNAEWMALLTLCPLKSREKYIQLYKQRQITRTELSDSLGIPESYVGAIVSNSYVRTLEILTGEIG